MQPEDLVDQTLGHYRIKQQVGQGGMATVYLAEDIHLGREVAIKAFFPDAGDTQDFLRRFTREARVLAQLDHPQILPVYDYGEQRGELAYLVTPYLSGGSLKDMLLERKVLPPSEAIKLLDGVLSALQYAHDRNLIHRDIKPGNLLFKADGTLVLADFGLAKVVEGDNQGRSPLMTISMTTDTIAGTPEYMAPEQIEGKVVPASDIYAVGIVLYEMVTGLRPFTGDSVLSILMKHIQQQPRPPREVNPYISTQLEAVILRALEKDLKKRFARPSELQQALAPANNLTNNRASNPGISGINSTFTTPDSQTSLVDSFSPLNNPPGRRVPDALSSPGHGGSLITFGTAPDSLPGPVNPSARPSQPGLDARSTELNTYSRGQVEGNFSAQSGQFGTQQNPVSSQAGRVNNMQAQPQNPAFLSSPQNMYQQNPGMYSSPQNINQQYAQQTPGIFPTRQSMNAPMGYPAPGQIWDQTKMPVPAPAPRRKRAPIVIMILLFILLAGLVTSLFATPLGNNIFHWNQGTATPQIGRYTTPLAGTGTVTTAQTQSTTPASNNMTQPMPATSTDCPASGTARAAVIAPLQLGHDPTIVYLVNDQNADFTAKDGTVKIIDTANQHKTELAKIGQAEIAEGQVSNDGQWVLFVVRLADQFQLRLVRLDGTGQQTLVCTSGNTPLANAQWSLDQKHVVFNEYPQSGLAVLYLLTMQTGALQVEIKANQPGVGNVEVARTWLDNSHVLLTGVIPNSDAGPENVFLLDLGQGANQNPADVPVIYPSSGGCWNFDSSYDGSKLFIVTCTPGQPAGSSKITSQPVQNGSGSAITVLNSSTEVFSTIRIINQQNSLLAVASDTAMGGPNGDPAHDGLYLIQTNGSKQRLFAPATGAYCTLNGYSQYFWSNVSRDGSQYALQTTVFNTGSSDYKLSYGSLSGGTPTSFVEYNQPVAILGWTTI